MSMLKPVYTMVVVVSALLFTACTPPFVVEKIEPKKSARIGVLMLIDKTARRLDRYRYSDDTVRHVGTDNIADWKAHERLFESIENKLSGKQYEIIVVKPTPTLTHWKLGLGAVEWNDDDVTRSYHFNADVKNEINKLGVEHNIDYLITLNPYYRHPSGYVLPNPVQGHGYGLLVQHVTFLKPQLSALAFVDVTIFETKLVRFAGKADNSIGASSWSTPKRIIRNGTPQSDIDKAEKDFYKQMESRINLLLVNSGLL